MVADRCLDIRNGLWSAQLMAKPFVGAGVADDEFPTPCTIAIVGVASGIGRAAAALMVGRGAKVICLVRDAKGRKFPRKRSSRQGVEQLPVRLKSPSA